MQLNIKNQTIFIVMVFILVLILTGCLSGLSDKVNKLNTGSVTGVVKDKQGDSLSGVSISIGNKTDKTNSDGVFNIEELETGKYQLGASLAGY